MGRVETLMLAALLICVRADTRTTVATGPDSSQAQNIEFLGQVGGACRAVGLSGDRLFMSQGPRLTVVDTSDPTRPSPGDSVLFPSLVRKIAGDGDRVAVITDGLWIIDAGSTKSLVPAGPLQLTGSAVDVEGELVYVVGASPNFQVVDASIPERPRLIGTYDVPVPSNEFLEVTDIVVQGEFAFLGYRLRLLNPGFPVLGGLAVLNLANPKRPELAVNLRLENPVASMAILGGTTLYLVTQGRIFVLDVANPRAPSVKDQIPGPGSPIDAAAGGNRLYVSAAGGVVWGQLRDTNDKTAGFGVIVTTGESLGLALKDDLLYVAGGWAGLRVHRFDEATTHVEVGRLTFPTDPWAVAIRGQFAYVADGRMGLHVFDLIDPDQPVSLGHVPTEDFARSVALSGDSVYVADEDGGLLVFDLPTSGLPRRIKQYPTSEPAQDVTTMGELVVVAEGPGGVSLLLGELSGGLAESGRFTEPRFAESVVVDVDRMFVGDQVMKAVWVVDISNPALPSSLGFVPTEGPAVDVSYDGVRLAVGETDRGLLLFREDGEVLPERVANLQLRGWVQAVELTGNLAYLADSRFGLRVVNVFEPWRPSEAGFYATPGRPRGVRVSTNGRIYLAAGEAGLYVFRYTWSPDLTMTGFDFAPQDVLAGEEILLEGTIANPSSVATPCGAWLDVMVSEEPDFSEPRRQLCPRVRIEPGFGGSDVLDLSERRFLVLSIPDGVYRVGVVVDTDDEVAEFREDNNVGWISHRPIYVGPRPARSRSWEHYR